MTTEEKARAYAEKAYYPAPEYGWYESDHEAMTDVLEQAYLTGATEATEALASQWVSVEERLPEDDTLVVVWVNSTILTDYCESGEWHYRGVRFWLPIPPLKGGDA